MFAVAIWIGAYLVAGFLYVRRDLAQPRFNRPAYVGSARGIGLVALLWPLVTIRMAFVTRRFGSAGKYLRKEALPTWAVFLVIGVLGSALI